jgi:hypothetical protein
MNEQSKYLYHFESYGLANYWAPYFICIAESDEEAFEIFKSVWTDTPIEIEINKIKNEIAKRLYCANKIAVSNNEQSRCLHIREW